MDWTQTLTIIGTFIALFGFFGGMFFYLMSRIDSDIQCIGRRLDGHATRIDQLYKMFVDLLDRKK